MKIITKIIPLILVFLLISKNSIAQIKKQENSDNVRISINPTQQSSHRLRAYLSYTISIYFLHNPFDYKLDYIECESKSLSLSYKINITLKSGTTWNIKNPPRQPIFFLFKFLLKSQNQAVIDRYNYVEFLSIWETRYELPYEMIENFLIVRDCFQEDEQKCFSIEYEIVPETCGKLKTVRREIRENQ